MGSFWEPQADRVSSRWPWFPCEGLDVQEECIARIEGSDLVTPLLPEM
ncbi:hypothetical protein KSC_105890 [Ktedonobacter sp. SOSP1-52]|nr:hypothetical protein KSC_105890 [Ktedonobacter sp. SOSP1-52]